MKRAVGRRRRSSSRKARKRTPSTHSPDDYIVQVLNDRSISDRDILITRQQYEDLKQCRKDLKSAQDAAEQWARDVETLQSQKAQADALCERLHVMVETMEERRQVDTRHLQELTAMNSKLTNDLRDAHLANSEQHRHSELAVSKLRSSLTDIRSVLECRAAMGQRELAKCLRVLSHDLSSQLAAAPYFPQKSQVVSLVQEAVGHAEDVRGLLASCGRSDLEPDAERSRLQDEVRRLRESSTSTREYLAALEKMKEQARLIKDRLRLMEGDFPYKKLVEDCEGRMQLLSTEKEMLAEHVKTLQATLGEQCSVIEHLKGIIASLASVSPEPRSVKVSPATQQTRSPETQMESLSPRDKGRLTASLFSPLSQASRSGGRDINEEIEALDHDIETLQTSLQRALQH